jgi:predicted deacetylase
MQTPAIIVSLHDVSPLTWARSRQILDDLAGLGIDRVSLLVIPNHHARAPITENPAFLEWLRAQAGAGHEIVAHGYFHQRSKKAGEGPWKKFITAHYTAGEGEFFDLTKPEADRLLRQGIEDFRMGGLSPRGFIAPAWLLGDAALEAVRDAGFEYTTYLNRIEPLHGAPPAFSQSLVWSVRAAWRRVLSLGWNRLLAKRLKDDAVIRVGLHPPDWDHPAIKRQILQLIRCALAGRMAFTYERWLEGLTHESQNVPR